MAQGKMSVRPGKKLVVRCHYRVRSDYFSPVAAVRVHTGRPREYTLGGSCAAVPNFSAITPLLLASCLAHGTLLHFSGGSSSLLPQLQHAGQ